MEFGWADLLASADFNTVKLWARDDTLLNTLTGHKNQVYGVSWSLDGQTLASAAGDNTVKLWKQDSTLVRSPSQNLLVQKCDRLLFQVR